MRVLLDESIPKKFGFMLTGHHVRTVQQMGWSGLYNGELLRSAAAEFDVLVSGDKNMEYQQNQDDLPISVIILVGKNNRLESFLPLVDELLTALHSLPEKCFSRIGA